MYKFRATVTNKHTHDSKSESSNNMTQLIKFINQSKNVSYEIRKIDTNKLMLQGNK